MAKSPIAKRDEQFDIGRRALIKWTVAAGAALGVSRSKVFEILTGTKTDGVAHALTTVDRTRSVHFAGSNGGHAWNQLLFPAPKIASANNPAFAYHKVGQGMMAPGVGNGGLWFGPDTPFQNLAAARNMSVFVGGDNNTHNDNALLGSTLNGSGIYAVASVLQKNTPTVIPIVTIGGIGVGNAPGFTQATGVGDGLGIRDLFNSAASQAGGLLEQTSHAQLYKAQYEVFAQLNRASGRSTQRGAYVTATNAATFLGTNLSSKLSISDADRLAYGIDGGMPGNVRDIAEALIITGKAFGLGLTNSVVIPYMRDDPHGAFNGAINTVPRYLKGVLDAFALQCTNTIDTASMKSVFDDLTLTFHGDTTKDFYDNNGWPDGTPRGSNVIYVLSPGHLKTGWFGGPDGQGDIRGIDPNGNDIAYNNNLGAQIANASIAYSIAKRDVRAINAFTNNLTVNAAWVPLDQ